MTAIIIVLPRTDKEAALTFRKHFALYCDMINEKEQL